MAVTTETGKLTAEWYFKRLTEKPDFFGLTLNLDPMWWKAYWLGFGGLFILLALLFIYWVYIKDGRAVGAGWGVFLAALRTITIGLLFFIWLLPTQKEKYTIIEESRVIWLFDVSNSMQQSDDDTSDTPNSVADTRQDHVVRFLTPETPAGGKAPANMVEGLTAKNPVYFYRFGAILDPSGWMLPVAAPSPSRQEWSRRLQPVSGGNLAEPISVDVIEEFLKAGRTLDKVTENVDGQAKEDKIKEVLDTLNNDLNQMSRVRDNVMNRTNYGAAVLEAINKESGKQVQAIIIVGDGRSNEGSTKDFDAIGKEAKTRGIPVMTMGVGKPTTSINLRVVDIRAPVRVQKEDDFKVEVLVAGENYTGKKVKIVLHYEEPGDSTQLTEEAVLTMTETSGVQSTAKAEFQMIRKQPASKPVWKLGEFKFHAEVGAPQEDDDPAKSKPPIKGVVERIKKERAISDNKSIKPTITKVDERKFNILLMAGAPMRDYTFLRTMLVREQDKFDTFVYFQPYKNGSVLDVDKAHMLITTDEKEPKFPDKLGERDANPMNLGNYDIIIAFDVNWAEVTKHSPDAIKNIKRWNEEFGGGIIFVAGLVNTPDVAKRPEFAPIRELLPVVLDGGPGFFKFLDRKSDVPYALNWDPAAYTFEPFNLTEKSEPDMPPKLTENEKFIWGWEKYFWDPMLPNHTVGQGDILRNRTTNDAEKESKRGFFSIFPIKDKKSTGVSILARYGEYPNKKYWTDPAGPLAGQQQPMFVLGAAENRKGAVFYIGSPEIWRMRAYNEKYHERFWTKLLRFIGKGDTGAGSRRGMLVVGQRYAEGDNVEVEVQLLTKDMQPYIPAPSDKVHMRIGTDASIDKELAAKWKDPGVELKSQHDLGRDGWFRGVFRVPRPGNYTVEVTIPGSTEALSGMFEVRAGDIERERNLPDFAFLHRMATEVGDLPEAKRKLPDLSPAVDKSKRVMKEQALNAPPGMVPLTVANERDRLFFTPETAGIIPELIEKNPQETTLDGKTTPLWDKGIGLLWMDHPEQADPKYGESDTSTGMTAIMNWIGRFFSWALLVVTLTLSAEWLTRKLLRLA